MSSDPPLKSSAGNPLLSPLSSVWLLRTDVFNRKFLLFFLQLWLSILLRMQWRSYFILCDYLHTMLENKGNKNTLYFNVSSCVKIAFQACRYQYYRYKWIKGYKRSYSDGYFDVLYFHHFYLKYSPVSKISLSTCFLGFTHKVLHLL